MPAVITVTDLGGDFSAKKILWETMGDAETGVSAKFPEYADRSVQVTGNFDTASVAIHGSNDGIDFKPLTNPQGVDIAINAAGIIAIQEITNYIRPVTSGGAGSADLDVTIVMRRPTQLRT